MVQSFTIEVMHRKKVVERHKDPDGTEYASVSWVDDHVEKHIVDVTVDMEGLARSLGPAAVKSKGGKSVEAGGLVVVRRRS